MVLKKRLSYYYRWWIGTSPSALHFNLQYRPIFCFFPKLWSKWNGHCSFCSLTSYEYVNDYAAKSSMWYYWNDRSIRALGLHADATIFDVASQKFTGVAVAWTLLIHTSIHSTHWKLSLSCHPTHTSVIICYYVIIHICLFVCWSTTNIFTIYIRPLVTITLSEYQPGHYVSIAEHSDRYGNMVHTLFYS